MLRCAPGGAILLLPGGRRDEAMDERNFYTEKDEIKQQTLVCPHCRQEGTYPIRWKVSTKKDQLPRGAGSEDRAKFERRAPIWSAWTTWWLAGTCAAGSASS